MIPAVFIVSPPDPGGQCRVLGLDFQPKAFPVLPHHCCWRLEEGSCLPSYSPTPCTLLLSHSHTLLRMDSLHGNACHHHGIGGLECCSEDASVAAVYHLSLSLLLSLYLSLSLTHTHTHTHTHTVQHVVGLQCQINAKFARQIPYSIPADINTNNALVSIS